MNKALDLYCADGGATRGLQLAGFHTTGVDIDAHPRYCGDAFIQANALTFPLDGFDFIWASPPCQAFTRLRHLHTRKYPKLIARTRARLVKSGIPFCIENVEEAPLGPNGNLIMLCGTMFGLRTKDGRAELRRHPLFETSFSIPLRPQCQHGHVPSLSVVGRGGHFTAPKVITVCGHTPVGNVKPATLSVCGTGLDDNRMRQVRAITVTGSTAQTNVQRNIVRETFTVEQAREAMGIDWMSMKGLSQAVPPAYSKFIAEQWLKSSEPRPEVF